MKKPKFSDSQILSILKQNEVGFAVPELCRDHGINSAAFYKWRKKYGGIDPSMLSRPYAIDTIEQFLHVYGTKQHLYWLLGADALLSFQRGTGGAKFSRWWI